MVGATSKSASAGRTAIIHFMIYSMHMTSSSTIDISMSSGHMFSLVQAAKDGGGGGGGGVPAHPRQTDGVNKAQRSVKSV